MNKNTLNSTVAAMQEQIAKPNDQAQASPAQENNETSPASAGGCLPRSCSALSGSFWESVWGELPESCKTPDGKIKMKINQNSPMILKGPDGHLVQLSPDNAAHLIPSAQAEFYQGEAVSPEICRQVWDEAKRYHRLSDESESVQ